MDWLDLLAVQGALKSLLQHHSSKASILRHSAFFIVQLSHPYTTTGKAIVLTRRTLVGKVMSLLLNMLSRLHYVSNIAISHRIRCLPFFSQPQGTGVIDSTLKVKELSPKIGLSEITSLSCFHCLLSLPCPPHSVPTLPLYPHPVLHTNTARMILRKPKLDHILSI